MLTTLMSQPVPRNNGILKFSHIDHEQKKVKLSFRKKSFDFKKEISSLQDGHSGLLVFLICGAVVKES